jgi:predicted MPP superfamily phosphohydrolase
LYWTVFWILAFSYLVARFTTRYLPAVSKPLSTIGSYWLAAMFYFLLTLLALDILRLVARLVLPASALRVSWLAPTVGTGVLLLVVGLVVYGTWNARHAKVNHYDLTIPKQAGSLDKLHAVMVSDIHLGDLVDNRRLEQMVVQINQLQPDVILFAGDIIDGDVEPFEKQNMAATLAKLKAPLGLYACLGNHEYIGGQTEIAAASLQKGGLRVLRDEVVEVGDAFYVAGRNDGGHGPDAMRRMDLAPILKDVDRSLPIILLDHQPSSLGNAEANGVDLQLSGHTHAGQMFPNRYITQRIFEVDWGYLRKGNLQVIVSDGYGTWGPPIRIGNTPEIVDMMITFK